MTKFALVSVVIPVLNESACLWQLHAELRGVCDRLPYAFEFVFVDDGSTDGTADVLRQLSELDERVRYLVLSRNFGHQSALSAGIAHTSGSAVIMMDGDLQHPPGLIPTLLERWRAGNEIVTRCGWAPRTSASRRSSSRGCSTGYSTCWRTWRSSRATP